MNGLRFKNPYDGDLMFLKMVEGTLRELNLDVSFPERNLELLTNSFPLMKFPNMTVVTLEDVGLTQMEGVADLFPEIERLVLKDNEIAGGLDFLRPLEMLAEIDLRDNPISVQENLGNLMLEVAPRVEIVNEKQVQEPGEAYRKEQQKILKQLEERLKATPSDSESEKNALANEIDEFKKGLENEKKQSQADVENMSIGSQAYKKKQIEFSRLVSKANE